MSRRTRVFFFGLAALVVLPVITTGCSHSTISRTDPQHKDNLTDKERNAEGEGAVTQPPLPADSKK